MIGVLTEGTWFGSRLRQGQEILCRTSRLVFRNAAHFVSTSAGIIFRILGLVQYRGRSVIRFASIYRISGPEIIFGPSNRPTSDVWFRFG